ncbi:MAG: hypothetical protein ACK4RT_07525, partial [Erythrobacter sp.]
MIPFLPELPAAPLSAAALPKALAGGAGAVANESGGRPPRDFAGLLDAALPGVAPSVPGAGAETDAPAPATPDPVPVMRPLAPLATGAKAGDEALPAAPPTVLPAALPPAGTGLPQGGSDLPAAASPAPAIAQPLAPPVA